MDSLQLRVDKAVQQFATCARAEVLRDHQRASCIAATWLAIAVFQGMGFTARELEVVVSVGNRPYSRRLRAERRPRLTDVPDAGMLSCGSCGLSMRSMKMASFGPCRSCRSDRASVWPSSSSEGLMPTGGILPSSRLIPTTISLWRKPDSTSGLPPLSERTGGEARRDLVGRPWALPCRRADWSSPGHRLAKRHVDQTASIGSRRSPHNESRSGEARRHGPRVCGRRRPCFRFGGYGVSDARDPQGTPQDAHSCAVSRGTRGIGTGD